MPMTVAMSMSMIASVSMAMPVTMAITVAVAMPMTMPVIASVAMPVIISVTAAVPIVVAELMKGIHCLVQSFLCNADYIINIRELVPIP
ncbi:hypothetical protein [Pollutimonas subterranea]|uniref:hypothetical protein n=1 Tax=Pollutimonas subterranea TaxID=2045210 RepID=UPI0013040A1A|nr:hypothetical protein [Pollutimonas subterranea]